LKICQDMTKLKSQLGDAFLDTLYDSVCSMVLLYVIVNSVVIEYSHVVNIIVCDVVL